jgi:hypothetical protein
MSLPIAPAAKPMNVKTTGGLVQSHAHILLYGKTKVGKTSTAVTMDTPENVRIISTQPEEQLAHLSKFNIPYVCVSNYEELSNALRDPRKLFPGEWTTLVLDDLTEAVEFSRAYHDGETKDGRQTYKAVGADVRIWLKKLMEADFNLVTTAFERSLQDETSPLIWTCPDLPPSTMSLVTAKFSFIFYVTPEHKLLTRPDMSRRILAGNRWPTAKAKTLADQEQPDLAAIWRRYREAMA